MDQTASERRLHTFAYPLTRLAGNLMFTLAVAVHVRFLGATPGVDHPVLIAAAALIGFSLVAWPALVYSRSPKRASGVLLALDIPVWTIAVAVTGGPESWLFFVPLLRVSDQAFFSFKRASIFCFFVVLSFALLCVLWPLPIESGAVFAKLLFLSLAGTYMALTARTADKLRHQLNAAMRRSEEAAEIKARFLANMSHEIRTPLNGVLGMNELLLASDLGSEQRRWAETIKSSGQHLLGMMNHVLDMSKLEAHKVELEAIDFDLRHLIEDVLTVFSNRAGRTVELVHFIDPAVPDRVRGDPGRLRQVLFNIIGNAIKFTERGEVALAVHGKGTSLRFSVRDTGPGIAPEALPRLFSSFTQADASTTRKHGGTGLGLAISRELVRLMGGDMHVESELGVGATFYFSIELQEARSLPTVLRGDARELVGARVLIIDDNATNRALMMALLLEWDVIPEAVPGGEDAYAVIENFDTAIVDMHMPKLDGLTVARELRRRKPDVRLVALTSMAVPGAARAAKEAGFDAFLTKPVRRAELLDCLLVLRQPRHKEAELITRHSLREAERREEPLVLVADDNETNQRVMQGMLQALGYQGDIVDSGQHALDALATERPYIALLLDCEMPEMDGFNCARTIRASGQAWAGMPIIALSAHTDPSIRARALEAGMDDWLSKPLSLDGLRRTLGNWLSKAAADLPRASSSITQAEQPTTSTRKVDDKVIADLRAVDGNDAVLERVLDLYFEDTQRRIDRMADAAAHQRQQELRDLAHALKGSSLSVGALAVAATCRVIERSVDREDRASVSALVEALPSDVLAFKDALIQHLGRSL